MNYKAPISKQAMILSTLSLLIFLVIGPLTARADDPILAGVLRKLVMKFGEVITRDAVRGAGGSEELEKFAGGLWGGKKATNILLILIDATPIGRQGATGWDANPSSLAENQHADACRRELQYLREVFQAKTRQQRELQEILFEKAKSLEVVETDLDREKRSHAATANELRTEQLAIAQERIEIEHGRALIHEMETVRAKVLNEERELKDEGGRLLDQKVRNSQIWIGAWVGAWHSIPVRITFLPNGQYNCQFTDGSRRVSQGTWERQNHKLTLRSSPTHAWTGSIDGARILQPTSEILHNKDIEEALQAFTAARINLDEKLARVASRIADVNRAHGALHQQLIQRESSLPPRMQRLTVRQEDQREKEQALSLKDEEYKQVRNALKRQTDRWESDEIMLARLKSDVIDACERILIFRSRTAVRHDSELSPRRTDAGAPLTSGSMSPFRPSGTVFPSQLQDSMSPFPRNDSVLRTDTSMSPFRR